VQGFGFRLVARRRRQVLILLSAILLVLVLILLAIWLGPADRDLIWGVPLMVVMAAVLAIFKALDFLGRALGYGKSKQQ
jgi:hypothetical protein